MSVSTRVVAVLLGVLAFGGLTAAVSAQDEPELATAPLRSVEEAGRDLYLADCVWCHGPSGEGTSRGSSLEDAGAASADFMLTTGRMPLRAPGLEVRRSDPVYDRDEIEALVAFVATLGDGPAIPEVDAAAGDITQGEELYRMNCAACHGPIGTGAALIGGDRAPPVGEATETQIAEALVIGPGSMPEFAPGVFDQHDMNAVVRYVTYLQDPTDAGGRGLGNLGPVAEGFVAWLAMLLPLLLFVVYIGKRAHD